MTPARPQRWLWVVFVAAWLTSLFWHAQRWQQESRHRAVEMVMDYNSIVDYARSQGKEWQDVLPEFKARGIQGLAFAELRLEELENYGICSVFSGVGLGTELGSGNAERPHPQKTYLVCWDRGNPLLSAQALESTLQAVFGRDKVRNWPTTGWERLSKAVVIEVALPLRAVQNIGVCLPTWGMDVAAQQKLQLWVRPENKPSTVTAEGVREYLSRLHDAYPQLEGIIFGGSSNEVVGYPEALDEAASLIGQYRWKLGYIELPKATQQKGIETLVRKLKESTVRVFAVPPAQQEKLKPERVGQMYGLAARERNLTVLYLRPYAFDPSPDKGFEDANQRLLQDIQADLQQNHLLADEAATFAQQVRVHPVGAALMAAGGMAAGLLVIGYFIPLPNTVLVAGVLAFTLVSGLAVSVGAVAHLALAALALGTACASCALAVVSQFERLRAAAEAEGFAQIMTRSTLAWVGMSAISLAGAWMASAFLQDTSYKLGLDIFRGVKVLTVITPLLITAAWALTPAERGHWLQIGSAPLRLYQLIGIAVLAVGGIFYTMRTGNMEGSSGGDALEYERHFRMVLDQTLGVRPRFKEFLLSHPAMLMVPFAIRWGWREAAAVLILVGSLGQAGLLDTFAHVHTPLKVSLIRAVMGLLFGAVLGWVYGLVLWKLAALGTWVKSRFAVST
jgi:hypothetical protein